MLNKECFDIEERLLPMMVKALDSQSIGLDIRCYSFTRTNIPTEQGNLPAWGLYYQCTGAQPGIENYLAQMTLLTNPYATQEDVNEAFAAGCTSLRQQRLAVNGIILGGNGHS
jgi:hypothetical protein